MEERRSKFIVGDVGVREVSFLKGLLGYRRIEKRIWIRRCIGRYSGICVSS